MYHLGRKSASLEAGSFASPECISVWIKDQRPGYTPLAMFGFIHNFYHHQSIESERTKLVHLYCVL